VSADGGLRSEVQALLPIPRGAAHETSAEQVDRLVREVVSLKKEIANLTEARQQAEDRIASLEAADQEPRDHPSVYWYSDLAALSYETPFPPRPSTAPALSRRSATVRTEGRDARRRDSAPPVSLEAPQ
jgi:hypothetical protein